MTSFLATPDSRARRAIVALVRRSTLTVVSGDRIGSSLPLRCRLGRPIACTPNCIRNRIPTEVTCSTKQVRHRVRVVRQKRQLLRSRGIEPVLLLDQVPEELPLLTYYANSVAHLF